MKMHGEHGVGAQAGLLLVVWGIALMVTVMLEMWWLRYLLLQQFVWFWKSVSVLGDW